MSLALQKLKTLLAKRDVTLKVEADQIQLGVPPSGQVIASKHTIENDEKIVYNLQQAHFINLVASRKSCALIGAAGTGKTTCTKGAIMQLIQTNKVGKLNVIKHKHLVAGTPGIVCTSFTNKAVQNMKRVLPHDLRSNCLTIHKLLEFAPEYFEVWDAKEGVYKKTMRFAPMRNKTNPLSSSIDVIIIDEAGMVPVDLWNMLIDALAPGHTPQIVLIFDIQQLPPVFGRSIAIHALQAGIARVELTEVYRQALESPIISLAHTILRGEVIPKPKMEEWNIDKLATGDGKVTVQPWKKALGADAAMMVMGKFLPELIDSGKYEPMEDVILSPFNKAFGTIEMNKIVATHLARHFNPDKEPVHEIIAGFNKKYFRIGEKVLWNKTEYTITNIEKNPSYFGSPFRAASITMDYDGVEHDIELNSGLASLLLDDSGVDDHLLNIDTILNSMSTGTDKSELVRAASHKITVYSEEFENHETLDTAGDLNTLDLAYAITVHKSQGSEYRRVFFITHESQSNMLFRELIYTAVTRAREELYVICPPSLFVKGVTSQRLPGKTLEDKIEAFERYLKVSRVSDDELPSGLYILRNEKLELNHA